jgi:hypothetical protein
MYATRRPRTTSTFRALAWAVLSLLAAAYLRVLVICSGPCCDAHVQVAFAERSCCAEHAGGCCASADVDVDASEVEREEPRSCCAHADHGAADAAGDERAPRDAGELETAGSCCTSTPVELAYGPLPLPPSWSRAAELAALTPMVLVCAAKIPVSACSPRTAMLADRLVDPPPLQNLRAIVSSTLLRI